MAPRRLRQSIGAVKDQISIGLAKVGSSTFSTLEVAIVKATRHGETPPDDRYVHEILSLTSYSRSLVNSCIDIIAKRLNKTRNWVVALKALMLVQQLLSEGGYAYMEVIFFSTRKGTRFLNMLEFRDSSLQSNAWDFSAFVRTYAMYLDQQLEFKMQGCRRRKSRHGFYNREANGVCDVGLTASAAILMKGTPVRDLSNEVLFSMAHHVKQLLERFIACRPTGAAKHNKLIAAALYPIILESFKLCEGMNELMAILTERFSELQALDMAEVFDIFCRASIQYEELDDFYEWCKIAGIGERITEYPEVEKIPNKKLDMMEDIIHQKTGLSRNQKFCTPETKAKSTEEQKKEPEEEEEDLFAIKALPPPTSPTPEVIDNEVQENNKKIQEIGDLLSLEVDILIKEQVEDQMALALFDGEQGSSASTTAKNPWEALKELGDDWETALVQSASQLSSQSTSFPGGFDKHMLDRMYHQQAVTNPSSYTRLESIETAIDPFAASLYIAPPSYVQMAEMELKQKLVLEEQFIWQQYARDGMQGQMGISRIQQQYPYGYITGVYTRTAW